MVDEIRRCREQNPAMKTVISATIRNEETFEVFRKTAGNNLINYCYFVILLTFGRQYWTQGQGDAVEIARSPDLSLLSTDRYPDPRD